MRCLFIFLESNLRFLKGRSLEGLFFLLGRNMKFNENLYLSLWENSKISKDFLILFRLIIYYVFDVVI